MFESGPVPVVIQSLKDRIEYLEKCLQIYPNLMINPDWESGEYLSSTDVNKKADQFKAVGYGFHFFYYDKKLKQNIFTYPIGVNVYTDEWYELDWLPELLEDEINPKVLVKLMRHVGSHYISNDYYHKKMPFIPDWLKKYK